MDVALSVQYGPFTKVDTLPIFHISSRKYYEVLNTGVAYKGYMYQNGKPFSVSRYGAPLMYTPMTSK